MHEHIDDISHKYPEAWEDIKLHIENIELAIEPDYIEEEVKGEPVLEQLWLDVQKHALSYVEVLCEYIIESKNKDDRESREDFQAIDEKRRITHNAFADSLKILARNMKDNGKDGTWYGKFDDSRIKMGYWAIKFSYDKILEQLNNEH